MHIARHYVPGMEEHQLQLQELEAQHTTSLIWQELFHRISQPLILLYFLKEIRVEVGLRLRLIHGEDSQILGHSISTFVIKIPILIRFSLFLYVHRMSKIKAGTMQILLLVQVIIRTIHISLSFPVKVIHMVELTLLILDVVLLDIVSPYLQTFLVDAFNLYYLQLSLSVK